MLIWRLDCPVQEDICAVIVANSLFMMIPVLSVWLLCSVSRHTFVSCQGCLWSDAKTINSLSKWYLDVLRSSCMVIGYQNSCWKDTILRHGFLFETKSNWPIIFDFYYFSHAKPKNGTTPSSFGTTQHNHNEILCLMFISSLI